MGRDSCSLARAHRWRSIGIGGDGRELESDDSRRVLAWFRFGFARSGWGRPTYRQCRQSPDAVLVADLLRGLVIFSRKGIAFGLIGALGAAVLFFTLAFSDAFVRDVWTREHP